MRELLAGFLLYDGGIMTEHEWDFAEVIGLTLKDRFESLCSLIKKIRVETDARFIVGHPQVTSIIETSRGYVGEYLPLGSFIYVGRLAGLAVFKSNDVQVDELIICGPSENSVIKVKNFIDLSGGSDE